MASVQLVAALLTSVDGAYFVRAARASTASVRCTAGGPRLGSRTTDGCAADSTAVNQHIPVAATDTGQRGE